MILRGKKLLLVGASSGIGRELTAQLLDLGVSIVAFSRHADALAPDFTTFVDHGRLEIITGDVRLEGDLRRLAEKVRSSPAPLDGLIYASGVSRPDFCEHPDIARSVDTLRINFEGAVRFIYEFLPDLMTRPEALICAFSSMAGMRGLPRTHMYSASKAALDRFLESLRIDLWQTRVNVFTVVPGYVKTPMTDQNTWPMPGLWSAPKAVRHILREISRDTLVVRFPWYHVLPMLIIRHLPDSMYCWLMNLQRDKVVLTPRPGDDFSW